MDWSTWNPTDKLLGGLLVLGGLVWWELMQIRRILGELHREVQEARHPTEDEDQ